MDKDVNAPGSPADPANLDTSPETTQETVDTSPPVDLETAPAELLDSEPDTIPKDTFKRRLDEVIAQRDLAEGKAAAAESARIAAEARANKAAEPPPITRDALRTAVEQGVIAQSQAEDAWDKELIRRAKDEAKREARNESTLAMRVAKVDAEIGRYRVAIPSVADKYSAERKVLEATYADIIDRLGKPTTEAQRLSYELSALRETYGGIENLEKTQTPRRPTRFTSREVGGSAPAPDTQDPVNALGATQKRYYAKMIERKVYKDWGDVRKELSWKRGDK